MTGIDEILAAGAVRSVFQPIVDLDTGGVVAYEALARGPKGPLERPDHLFAAAREAGQLRALDELCRRTALVGAIDAGLRPPLALFVNVEPQVLDTAPLEELLAISASAPDGLEVVLEITERAIAARPAELLATVTRLRAAGWCIALDDVGADDLSLAFMPLLRPDIVKLDLRLVQQRPGPAVAEIMNAVNAYAERTGAVLLAEGIEDESHVAVARALGAKLGQGWLFGRPAPTLATALPVAGLELPRAPLARQDGATPFSCLPAGTALRRSTKPLLIEVSKHLEREALRHGSTCIVVATFQEARHFTPATTHRYRELAECVGFVAAIGEGLDSEPAAGVRGADLLPDDQVRGEWDIAVLSPHFAAALLARDLGDVGPDLQRTFEFALTYDRDVVADAAAALMSRVLPAEGARTPLVETIPTEKSPAVPEQRLGDVERTLRRALAATSNGVAISDMTRPQQPLVYVNKAFERLSGLRAEEVMGRNCDFLQGPVFDEDGRLVHYIGVQNDVTARVEVEAQLGEERERAEAYADRVQKLAHRDPLTGTLNRRRLSEVLESTLLHAQVNETGAALLHLDLDGFRRVNDEHGHAAGDQLLQAVADRLRRGDLVARLGSDEFLVVLPGLDQATATDEGARVARELRDLVGRPVRTRRAEVHVGASIGVAAYPADGTSFDELLHAADRRMHEAKVAARR